MVERPVFLVTERMFLKTVFCCLHLMHGACVVVLWCLKVDVGALCITMGELFTPAPATHKTSVTQCMMQQVHGSTVAHQLEAALTEREASTPSAIAALCCAVIGRYELFGPPPHVVAVKRK